MPYIHPFPPLPEQSEKLSLKFVLICNAGCCKVPEADGSTLFSLPKPPPFTNNSSKEDSLCGVEVKVRLALCWLL